MPRELMWGMFLFFSEDTEILKIPPTRTAQRIGQGLKQTNPKHCFRYRKRDIPFIALQKAKPSIADQWTEVNRRQRLESEKINK